MFSKSGLLYSLLFVICVCGGAYRLWAETPTDGMNSRLDAVTPWSGLPETLAWSHGLEEDFEEFHQDLNTMFAPLATRARLNGQALNTSRDREVVEKIFKENFYVHLPRPIQITELIGIERWEYPLGFEILHRIEFLRSDLSPERRLFELRVVKKVRPDRYAYGVYVPECDMESCYLRLKTQDLRDFVSYEFTNDAYGDVKLEISALGLATCQRCHFFSSPSREQFVSQEEAGPCGFGPANEFLNETWIQGFRERQGFDPFVRP